ncbi:MAG: hypothetical protein ACREQ5_07175 [Candidatus Dormibacteria bacterium]
MSDRSDALPDVLGVPLLAHLTVTDFGPPASRSARVTRWSDGEALPAHQRSALL